MLLIHIFTPIALLTISSSFMFFLSLILLTSDSVSEQAMQADIPKQGML